MSLGRGTMDVFEHRAALAILARGVLRRRLPVAPRHWMTVWPGIPR